MKYTISSHGDAGDLCALLPIARFLGKADILVSDSKMCKPIVSRLHLLKDLLESQPYIGRIDEWRGEEITHDVAPWREGGVKFGSSLLELHAAWVGLEKEVSEEPWLTVKPNNKFKDKIILNRSTRHRSDFFPWAEIMRHFPVEDMVFLGLEEEWQQHVNEFGVKVPYHPTKNFLEAAEIIQAGKILMANQSCQVNIAIGLGKRFCLESSLSSVDCLYRRPDSIYVVDGEMNLEVEGYDPLITTSRIPDRELDSSITPPGGYWIYDTKDGVRHKEITGFDLLRSVNRYERANDLPISKLNDINIQMGLHFPSFGSDNYTNHLIERIHTIKKLIWEKQQ
jgi:hypothetical protein